MRAHDLRHNMLVSGLVEEDDSVGPKHEGASNPVAAAVTQAGRIVCPLSQSSYHSMASPPRILVEFLRRFLPTKDHIKRFLRRWAPLFTYLVRKLGEWRFLWGSKSGTIRSPKPPESSLPSDKVGSSSVPSGSVCTGGIDGYVIAASTVPASANHPLGRESAQPQSDTAPPTPTLATLHIDPSLALGPSAFNQTVGNSHANHSTGHLSVQSRASDRLSMISASRTSLRAPVQNDRPSRDPKATYRLFGRGPGSSRSRSRGRSPRSPSPQPSLNTAQPDNFDIASTGAHTYAHADGVPNSTIGFQSSTDLPSSSHTQERPGRPAIRRQKQKTTSIGWNVQIPSTETLPIITVNAQEITEEPMAMDTDAHSPRPVSPSDRAETASQNSHTAAPATSVLALLLPEGRSLQMINSDQIPRYTKNATM